jgi:hypothetical protein
LSAHLSVCVGVGVDVCFGNQQAIMCNANAWGRYRLVATGAFARDRDPAVDSAATWLVGERANGLAKCVHGGEEP